MKSALLLVFLLVIPLASAGDIEILLHLTGEQDDVQWNVIELSKSIQLREDAFESGGEFIIDLQEENSFPFLGSFPQDSYLFKALSNTSKGLEVTGVGGNCKAVFFQVFQGGVQRHVFDSEGKTTFYLVKNDFIYLGVIPEGIGECSVSFKDSNRSYSVYIDFKFYPEIYDFIKPQLFETENCMQTFYNKERDINACYTDWKQWGCTDQEFLAMDKESCLIRLNQQYILMHQYDVNRIEDLNKQSLPQLAQQLNQFGQELKNLAFSTVASEEQAWNLLIDGLLVLGIIFGGAFVYLLWRNKREEDSFLAPKKIVSRELPVKERVISFREKESIEDYSDKGWW